MTLPLSLTRIQISITLISAALISYQVVLVKIFSIQYWYHFAYLIISLALLGFGASGTFIFLSQKMLKDRFPLILFTCPLLFVLSIWTNIYLARVIAFNPLMLIWQSHEIYRFLLLSICIFIPFFFGALCICLSFTAAPDHIHKIYFANLTGSGLGCVLILITFFHAGPYDIVFAISIIATGASLAGSTSRTRMVIALATMAAMMPLHMFIFRHVPLEMSVFKDLPQAQNLAEAKKEKEIFGPLGLVTVLDSPAYHYLPDLSLNCPYELPAQKGLFLDGNTVGAINQFHGNADSIRYMDYRTNSLPYKLLEYPDVLIIGGSSGTEILNARYHSARNVSAVEMNRDIVHLMQSTYRTYSGEIYDARNTHIVVEEGRGYLQKTDRRFDLIQMNLSESMGAASAGVYSLNENYLFTTEALRLCLDRLKPGGLISISLWIKYPPRTTIKILATAIDALETRGREKPADSIMMIRSWQTATLIIKNGSFRREDIESVRKFCKSRFFDISYHPGIRADETNIFNKLEEELLYEAAISLLSPQRERFYTMYPFHIRPATDDMPFFSHFFKIQMIKHYTTSFDRALIPFMDWGYILVWIAACILFLLGIIFILIPLPFSHHPRRGLTPVIVYFGALGMAYMLLEISILQQFIRYLYDPVFSATVVIGSFLVYSGIGSLIAGRAHKKIPVIVPAVIAICIMCLFVLTFDWWLQNILSSFPLWLRMVICSLIIAPLAIPMGIPFPSGLSELASYRQWTIPWAWSVNGFFSVMGGSFAVLIAIEWGFTSVTILATILYIISAVMFTRLRMQGAKD
jgi:spermidine synthase